MSNPNDNPDRHSIPMIVGATLVAMLVIIIAVKQKESASPIIFGPGDSTDLSDSPETDAFRSMLQKILDSISGDLPKEKQRELSEEVATCVQEEASSRGLDMSCDVNEDTGGYYSITCVYYADQGWAKVTSYIGPVREDDGGHYYISITSSMAGDLPPHFGFYSHFEYWEEEIRNHEASDKNVFELRQLDEPHFHSTILAEGSEFEDVEYSSESLCANTVEQLEHDTIIDSEAPLFVDDHEDFEESLVRLGFEIEPIPDSAAVMGSSGNPIEVNAESEHGVGINCKIQYARGLSYAEGYLACWHQSGVFNEDGEYVPLPKGAYLPTLDSTCGSFDGYFADLEGGIGSISHLAECESETSVELIDPEIFGRSWKQACEIYNSFDFAIGSGQITFRSEEVRALYEQNCGQ